MLLHCLFFTFSLGIALCANILRFPPSVSLLRNKMLIFQQTNFIPTDCHSLDHITQQQKMSTNVIHQHSRCPLNVNLFNTSCIDGLTLLHSANILWLFLGDCLLLLLLGFYSGIFTFFCLDLVLLFLSIFVAPTSLLLVMLVLCSLWESLISIYMRSHSLYITTADHSTPFIAYLNYFRHYPPWL